MPSKPISCPPRASLLALIDDDLSEEEERTLSRHLDDCESCQKALDLLAGGGQETLANVGAVLEMERNDEATLESGWAAVLDTTADRLSEGIIGWIGPFEILEHVASGGMGIVFKARDPATNRMVALKVLAPIWAANPVARARFLREARAAAALDHENVLAIYSVNEEGRYPYLVLPFNDGETLEQRVQSQGRLEYDEILRIGIGIVKGLEAAHEKGIVHRDLKPANILLQGAEDVRIADFGLARAADTPELTVKGNVPGTPQFMAPEQIRGEEVDARADLFSFGAVLQYMATGKPPFGDGACVSEILEKVTTSPPLKIDHERPAWSKYLLAGLLEKDPSRRLTDTRRIHGVLEEERPPVNSKRFFLAGIGALLLTLFVVWQMTHQPAPSAVPTIVADFEKAYAINVRTGNSFNDLPRALSHSKPGDTFELSGTFHLYTALTTPPSHPISFRAVEGASPTLAVSKPLSRCLIVNSDASFEDIRFVRTTPLPAKSGRYPTIVWVKKADDVRFTRCRFEVAWEPGVATRNLTGCLGISIVKRCLVDQCEIIGMSSAALNVDRNAPVETHLEIRDTVIVAKRAMMRNEEIAAGAPTNLHCVLERCTVVAAEGLRHICFNKKWSHPMRPLEIVVSDSVVHTTYDLMHFPDAAREQLRAHFEWRSRDCKFDFGRVFIDCSRQYDRDHEPHSMATLGDALALDLQVSDERSEFHSNGTKLFSALEALGAKGVTKASVAAAMPVGWNISPAK